MSTVEQLADFLRKPIDDKEDYVNALVNTVPNTLKRSLQDKLSLIKKGALHTECIESYHRDIEWEFAPHTALDVNGNFEFTVTLSIYYEFVNGAHGTRGAPNQVAAGKELLITKKFIEQALSKGFTERQLTLLANDLRNAANQYAAECFKIVVNDTITALYGDEYGDLFRKAFFAAFEVRKNLRLKAELCEIAKELENTKSFAKSKIIAAIRVRLQELIKNN